MPTTRDYYEVLSVERNADGEAIKRAYRKLALKYHPDRNQGDKDAEARFKEAAEAYEVLTDPDKRARYDRYGHEGLRGTSTHDFGRMNPDDIFSMFGLGDLFDQMFGGQMGGRRRGRGNVGGARRGYDLQYTAELSLAEVAAGIEKEIEFTRQDRCATCKGSGAKDGSEPVTCVTCGGVGQVAQSGLGGMFRIATTCPACRGAGKVIRDPCPTCKGTGLSPKKRVLTVKVPPGIHDGQAIRIGGEGEPGEHGGPRGDLHVVVRVQPHKVFERDDDDLILKMPISFTQAALGAQVEVPTLDSKATLVIPRGSQHGDVHRLRGHGLPNLRTGEKGDLIIVTLIEVPTKLSTKQEDLLREYAKTEDSKVMPHTKGFWDKIREYLG